ncbi:hypothetical protein QUW15_04905, partial [Desulfovibrio piger]|nr:hypothetical protein [Desulfovibrio piger]
KKRGFSAHFEPGGAVPPPRVSSFSKLKRSNSSISATYAHKKWSAPEKARWGKDGGLGGKETPLAR